MNILLIGEFNKIHWTLADTLRVLGHKVDVLSNDNLWHSSSNYVSMINNSTNWGAIKHTFNLLKVLPQLRGYDIVQLINPYFFEIKEELLLYIYQYLRKNNRKIFLGGFGNDFYWVSECLNNSSFRYSDFYANDTYRDTIDNQMAVNNWMHGYRGELNRIIANDCNGIITGFYESFIAYKSNFPDKTIYIPYPIEPTAHPQSPPTNIKKVKFYITMQRHREELKGKDELYRALYTLSYAHPNECEVTKTICTLYDEFEHLMDGCDVMMEQLYSYSPGISALQAMNKGIVVVGGGEEEYYDLLGEKNLRPIINVRPEGNDIYDKLTDLLANKSKIAQLSKDSVSYIKKHHNPISVAKRCLEFWS